MNYQDRVQLGCPVASLRKEIFDLARDLRGHCLTGGLDDVSTALIEIQSVANRLGRVEAVLGPMIPTQ